MPETPMTAMKPLNVAEIMLRNFIASKRKLPQSQNELAEWFMEWDRGIFDLIAHLQQQFEEHLTMCNRPIILDARTLKEISHDHT